MDSLAILPYNLRFALTRLEGTPNSDEENKDAVPRVTVHQIISEFTLLRSWRSHRKDSVDEDSIP